ncbi:HAMP domain-containing sensor histidine kinase [Anaerolentibacter hominis]|uniref:sensor histidine kinase n=1 Tax=Anaerolentibacter hominis TaxID=3079009 RepID=UPI0031B83417
MTSDFKRLKRKFLGSIVMCTLGALAVLAVIMKVFVDGLLQAPFAEGFVRLCQKLFHMSYYDGVAIYQYIFLEKKALWIALAFFLLLIVAIYIALNRFTAYFTQINHGLDHLIHPSEEPVSFKPELEFMERKFTEVSATLEKREKDARDAEQRKNDLVLYLAHDIRTPLTSVIGYLSLLEEAPDMPVEQRAKYTKITLEKAYRLEQLLNEFFEITRYNLQTIILNKEEIHLDFMLLQIADEFYPILESEGKTIEVHVPDNLTIIGDADKLARVFNNILKNAAAYSSPDTVIEVEVVQEGAETVISFKNKGKLIPEAQLNQIFEKFYRVDSSRTSSTGGSGLGLAIAREIVNAHGGSIAAKSGAQGTVFTVRLPSK